MPRPDPNRQSEILEVILLVSPETARMGPPSDTRLRIRDGKGIHWVPVPHEGRFTHGAASSTGSDNGSEGEGPVLPRGDVFLHRPFDIRRGQEGDSDMWAQLIKARLRPGKEGEVARLFDQMRALEQPGSGLLRELVMLNQKDPNCLYVLAEFESEEKARAREKARAQELDPRRWEALQALNATMSEVFEAPPEFVDLTVVGEMAL